MTFQPDPENIRTVNPSSIPQFPFDSPPRIPESSAPDYTVQADCGVRIPMRDGVRLAADIYRPSAPGQKFPALVAVSPYTRQLQQTAIPLGQNEAGITEFWVPRGYAHVIVDVRGSNDSEGSYDLMGPREQGDLFDIIEWVAQQPWCSGSVGMTGCSYFGWSQMMAATQQPPHLKAVFAFDAATDLYRDVCFHGGIFNSGFANSWFPALFSLDLRGERLKDPTGILEHARHVLSWEHPFDGPYYRERLSNPRLDRVRIPVYFVCDWAFYCLHLRGAFEGWAGVGDIPKKMLVGPSPRPARPLGAYHQEALRWYDHHLKGMDTRVREGPPIQFYIPGLGRWRGEKEWPLGRTQWQEFYLAGKDGESLRQLLPGKGAEGQGSYRYDPVSPAARLGQPKLVYRSEPLEREMEVTGPIALYLNAASSATDTDWFASFRDEAPDGSQRELCRGWLRASHRELDAERSQPWRPFHPHLASAPLKPGQAYEYAIELWPTSNLFKAGHRLRLEIASGDDQSEFMRCHQSLPVPATNTILEGGRAPSRLLLPVIPSR
ncbi:MAG: CocE/NonD family hydrolase [Chloroflexota bacterium]